MPDYKFTGDDTTDFPSLGKTLSPGDVVTLEEPIDHPLLAPVKTAEKPKEK